MSRKITKTKGNKKMKAKQINIKLAAFLVTAAIAALGACNPGIPAYTMIDVPKGTITGEMTWSSNTNYPIPEDGLSIPAFKIGETEVAYELWYAVTVWAQSHGYTFADLSRLNTMEEALEKMQVMSHDKTTRLGREGHNGEDGAVPKEDKEILPVTNVSWRDCVAWCNAYSEARGKTPVYYEDAAYTVVLKKGKNAEKAYIKAEANGFRLPTEAQWEYAARGGKPDTAENEPWTYTYAGSNTIDDVAWYYGNAGSETHAVKTKQPNSLGLYGMSGNVLEWCWDKYAAAGAYRVQRGGSWGYGPYGCTLASRESGSSAYKNYYMGFRVVSL
jgi:formylglycine-generating enzyme required for sulfatase activity